MIGSDGARSKAVDLGLLADAGIGELDLLPELALEVGGDRFHAVLAGDIFVHVERFAVFLGLFLCLLGVL